MKRSFLIIFLTTFFVFSCSTESTDDGNMDPDMEQGADDDTDDGMSDDDTDDGSDGGDGGDGMDDNPDNVGQDIMDSDLVGVWVLTDLRFDESLNDDDLNFAKQILDYLNENECDLVTFTFNEDATAVSEDKIDHLSINVGVGGLEIPCPEESDVENTTWSVEGDQLTLTDEAMEESTITISLEDENTLVIDGADVDPNNYQGAEAVFTKRVEE